MKPFLFCGLVILGASLPSMATVRVAGSSITEILDSSGNAAESYQIGYFGDTGVPVSEANWADFTPFAGIGEKFLGVIDQTGSSTPLPGQFAFSEDLTQRSEVGLLLEGNYPRRIGIRFFDSTGNEWNTVTANYSDWVIRDPEAVPAPLGADLNLSDSNLVWEFPDAAFQTVPEPSALLLMLSAAVGVFGRRRRFS